MKEENKFDKIVEKIAHYATSLFLESQISEKDAVKKTLFTIEELSHYTDEDIKKIYEESVLKLETQKESQKDLVIKSHDLNGDKLLSIYGITTLKKDGSPVIMKNDKGEELQKMHGQISNKNDHMNIDIWVNKKSGDMYVTQTEKGIDGISNAESDKTIAYINFKGFNKLGKPYCSISLKKDDGLSFFSDCPITKSQGFITPIINSKREFLLDRSLYIINKVEDNPDFWASVYTEKIIRTAPKGMSDDPFNKVIPYNHQALKNISKIGFTDGLNVFMNADFIMDTVKKFEGDTKGVTTHLHEKGHLLADFVRGKIEELPEGMFIDQKELSEILYKNELFIAAENLRLFKIPLSWTDKAEDWLIKPESDNGIEWLIKPESEFNPTEEVYTKEGVNKNIFNNGIDANKLAEITKTVEKPNEPSEPSGIDR